MRLRVTPEQVEMRMHRVHPDEGPRHTRHSRDVGAAGRSKVPPCPSPLPPSTLPPRGAAVMVAPRAEATS